MMVIPAMDLIDGCCVRLSKGDYASKRVYSVDPVAIAKELEAAGLHYLHLVDLDGAKAGHVVNHRVLERIASGTSLLVDVGGGLKTAQDFALVFACGAAKATVGSLAATDRDTTLDLLAKWGPERLSLGADCKEGMIAVSGWQTTTSLQLHEFTRGYLRAGFKTVISTDISRDGMLSGAATRMYQDLTARMQEDGLVLELVASGGVRNLADLDELAAAGLWGAIVGKALYEGAVTATDLADWQARQEVKYVG